MGAREVVQKRNIKQEKLVFHPEIRFPASKPNRLQRGGLFVLLHQACLLYGRSGSRSKEQVKEQEKQSKWKAAHLTPCCIPGPQGSVQPAIRERGAVLSTSAVRGMLCFPLPHLGASSAPSAKGSR